MIGYSVQLATGRVFTGELDVFFKPRNGTRGKRGVLLIHGAGGSALNSTSSTTSGELYIAHTLAMAGFTVVAGDFGGTQTWGNDTVVGRLETARQWLVSQGCASDKVVLVGLSMGGLNSFNYARTYPDKVAAIAGIMPVSNLDDFRDNNRLGAKSLIESAWGISTSDPLPTRANPIYSANTSITNGIPYHAWYSTGDTACPASTVTALVSAVGGTSTVVGSMDHSQALASAVSATELSSFVDSHLQ